MQFHGTTYLAVGQENVGLCLTPCHLNDKMQSTFNISAKRKGINISLLGPEISWGRGGFKFHHLKKQCFILSVFFYFQCERI